MGQPVVHWEIVARDARRLQDFYRALFAWKVDAENPMQYGIVDTGGEGGINGGIMQSRGDMLPYLTIYVQVDDLQAYLDRAQALGAKTIVPPTPIPGVGAFAMFSDPEGNAIGLFKG